MQGEVIYSVRGPKNLTEMSWQDVADALKKTDLVIVPVCSTEEHGPHMPLAADTIQGTEITRRIAAKFAANGLHAVAGPPIPYGVSSELMDFPGTITLSTSTLTAVVKEVCTSLIRHGFRKLVLLIAHDGNLGATYCATQELSQLPDVRVLTINIFPPLMMHYQDILVSKEGGHGGEGETARVLAVAPELVRMDRARAHNPPKRPKLQGDVPIHFGGSVLDPPRGMKELTPVGSLGDPTVATAATGEKCYDVIVDWAYQAIRGHFGL